MPPRAKMGTTKEATISISAMPEIIGNTRISLSCLSTSQEALMICHDRSNFSTSHPLCCLSFTACCCLRSVGFSPCTLYPVPCTLYPVPCTLFLSPAHDLCLDLFHVGDDTGH